MTREEYIEMGWRRAMLAAANAAKQEAADFDEEEDWGRRSDWSDHIAKTILSIPPDIS